MSGLGKGLWLSRKRVQQSEKVSGGGGKLSAFVHCHSGAVVSIFTCDSFPLLYTFAINIVAVTVGFVISLLSPVNGSYLNPWSLSFVPCITGLLVGVQKWGIPILNSENMQFTTDGTFRQSWCRSSAAEKVLKEMRFSLLMLLTPLIPSLPVLYSCPQLSAVVGQRTFCACLCLSISQLVNVGASSCLQNLLSPGWAKLRNFSLDSLLQRVNFCFCFKLLSCLGSWPWFRSKSRHTAPTEWLWNDR